MALQFFNSAKIMHVRIHLRQERSNIDQSSCRCLKFGHMEPLGPLNHNEKVGINSAFIHTGIRTIQFIDIELRVLIK